MSGIDKAVILAAGRGNRISKASKGTPKPLLPLDGGEPGPSATTFLDWHLRSLARAGAKEIYLVGNSVTFGTKLRAMAEIPSAVKVEWILNPTEDLSTSGSGHSAQYAFHSPHGVLDGRSRVVLMDADVLYEPRIFDLAARAEGSRSKTLVCADYRHTHEEVLVFSDPKTPDSPRFHGKGLLGTALVDGLACAGEATGILLFEPGDHGLLREVTDWTIGFSTAKARSEHEDVTQRMMLLGRMMTVPFGKELAFMECDTPEEYDIVTREMYPRVKALLG
ncbi:MAG: NTP transferase domain-containing protein [Myxococcales bacterium]|jgi:choline kinase|nr:NTP transferase domain-containing protein [Myxococcales bacterium]